MKNVLIIGSGLGSLATALRLSSRGYQVTIFEQYHQAGGRLNRLDIDGFKFDLGPSFMSMSYELDELFTSCAIPNPFKLTELDPLHHVYFSHRAKPYRIWKNLKKLEAEFSDVEPDLAAKLEPYLKRAKAFYHDTDQAIIKTNFYGYADYARKLCRVPVKHLPYVFRSLWSEVSSNFSSQEVRVILSLIAFFLGTTPFKTPAIFSMLNYVELQHNGYWTVEGGIYHIVEKLVELLKARGVQFVFRTSVVTVEEKTRQAVAVVDHTGKRWAADIFICNADAASFRGEILRRKKYSPARLDKMEWSMAPFTLYLGVRGKIPAVAHHNYFLGSNFEEYSRTIFTSTTSPQKPYYYMNVPTKSHPEYAPDGCESLFVLCPVPDLRFKKDWADRDNLADQIIQDLSLRIGFDIPRNIVVKKILTPVEWREMFNLYQGSGLGLCHGFTQLGIFRPQNKDENLKNFYYVGASTIPGTGLPMVIISSKLVLERIQHDSAAIS